MVQNRHFILLFCFLPHLKEEVKEGNQKPTYVKQNEEVTSLVNLAVQVLDVAATDCLVSSY